jgi:hypothetical protein
MRLKGTEAAFFTVFELVAGEESVWLDVPREEILVCGARGDSDWEALPLSPEALLIALLADPCPEGACFEEELQSERDPERIRLVGSSFAMELDPRSGLPLRCETEGERGALVVEWRNWVLHRDRSWPSEIAISRGRMKVEIRMGRVLVDPPISERLFAYEADPDREILTPAEAKDRWRRSVPSDSTISQ